MDFDVGDTTFERQQAIKRAQDTRDRRNPDNKAKFSTAVTIFAIGLLIGAIAVFTYHWVHIANEDAQTRRAIDNLGRNTDGIAAFLGNFSVTCNCSGLEPVFPETFADTALHLYDPVDPSKLLQFSANNISTASLQNLKVQNDSGVVAYLANVPAYPFVFLDDAFTIVNADDVSKAMMLNCSLIDQLVTRVLTVPDKDGTIALVSDIPVPTAVFPDDEFRVQHFADTTAQMAFEVDGISPATTQLMTIQDTDCTIACLDQATPPNGSFSDAVFGVYAEGDMTSLMMLDASTLITPGNVSVMTVQDQNGTIAYVDQVEIYVDVVINESRTFPDLLHEGVSTLLDLEVTQLQAWGCGAGGGGGGSLGSTNSGGGGGSGSGFEVFLIDNAAALFTSLTCTVGAGGAGGLSSTTTPTAGGDGGITSIVGVPVGETSYLELYGYGGGGGLATGGAGGGGGGSGASAAGNSPGGPGSQGGLAGGVAGMPGAFRYPWHAGSGGGAANTTLAAPWYGGGDAGSPGSGGLAGGGGGAGGMFGTGGNGGDLLNDDGTDGGLCAGGGGASFTDDNSNVGGNGGDGSIFIRYWIV